jgi:hypothetical protein
MLGIGFSVVTLPLVPLNSGDDDMTLPLDLL